MHGNEHVCCVCRRRLRYAFVQRRRSVRCSRCEQMCCTDCVVTHRYASWQLSRAADGLTARNNHNNNDGNGSSSGSSNNSSTTPSALSTAATRSRDDGVAECAWVCATCHARPNMLQRLPRTVWEAVCGYCDRATQQRLLQLCHMTQMGVVLPYPYYARGWSMLFGERRMLYEGANGQVCRTTLQPGVGGAAATHSSSSLRQSETEVVVAVKVIAKANLYSLRRWDYVQREVTALQRCRHSHVVGFYFAAQGPSEVYVVLQYLRGGDLFDWLVRQQMPLEADVRVIAVQLLTTLHYMHEVCGVVHRDIKPENILLDTNAYNNNNNNNNNKQQQQQQQRANKESGRGTPSLHIRLADFGYCKVLAPPTRAAQRSALRAALACATRGVVPATHDAQSRRRQTSAASAHAAALEWVVSATPCGTLGFAAPEVMHAYTAKQQAMRDASTSTTTRASPPRTPVTVGSSHHSHARDDGSRTPVAHATDTLTLTDALKRLDVFAAGVTLCVLLTGCEPFPCHSPTAYLQAVARGVDFGGLEWAHVSLPAKTLLRSMLAASAAQRPTVLACLQSEWLRDARTDTATEAGVATSTTATATTSDCARARTAAPALTLPSSSSSSASSSSAATTTTTTAALTDAVTTAVLSSSFRDSVHSLRKNGGWLFVQDEAGQVTTLARDLVTSDEDAERGGWARRFAGVADEVAVVASAPDVVAAT